MEEEPKEEGKTRTIPGTTTSTFMKYRDPKVIEAAGKILTDSITRTVYIGDGVTPGGVPLRLPVKLSEPQQQLATGIWQAFAQSLSGKKTYGIASLLIAVGVAALTTSYNVYYPFGILVPVVIILVGFAFIAVRSGIANAFTELTNTITETR